MCVEGIYKENGGFYERKSIRAHGRPAKLKVGRQEFLFFCKQGHPYELIRGKRGEVFLFCPFCNECVPGVPKAGVKLFRIPEVKVASSMPFFGVRV